MSCLDDATSRTLRQSRDRHLQCPSYPSPFFAFFAFGGDDGYDVDKPRCLLELRANALSNVLREKEDWWLKCQDPDIAGKWRKEALEQQADVPLLRKVTAEMVDYVIQELQGYAKHIDPENGMQLGCFERIWRSDIAVPPDLRRRLLSEVDKLEAEPKDWHPNSGDQVLDLVHPSLYPLVFKQSILRDESGGTSVAKVFKLLGDDTESPFVSKRFQWLASDFRISERGDVALQSPYINNIHPTEWSTLNHVIIDMVTIAVPFFERILSDLANPLSLAKVQMTDRVCDWGWGEDDLTGLACIWPDQNPVHHSGTSEGGIDDPNEEEWLATQDLVLPQALPAYEGALNSIQKTVSLKGKSVQVIVKLANIHLTPQSPTYAGGSWHVEGMRNENIVSTFLYYYDEANITESSLAFRTAVATPIVHAQDDDECMRTLYGLKRDDPLIQDRGSMLTKEGRIVAFPNIYQHCVQPFELKDRTRPGHRKILALFLIDPYRKVASTTSVGPQQKDWIAQWLAESELWRKLPTEIADKILGLVPGLMTREAAESFRLELMSERTATVFKDQGRSIFSAPFNMCEH